MQCCARPCETAQSQYYSSDAIDTPSPGGTYLNRHKRDRQRVDAANPTTGGAGPSNSEDTPVYEDTPDNEAVHEAVHWAVSPPVTTEKTSKQAIDLRESDEDEA